MSSHVAAASFPAGDDPHGAILGTVPLLILVGFLFVAAYFVFLLSPTLGPSVFPLWGLFVALGIIAAAGAFVSWAYSADEVPVARARTRSIAAPASPSSTERRSDFGRPTPDIARVENAVPAPVVTAPWDEDVLPLPVSRAQPFPDVAAPPPPSDISRALDEIADIQRQLMTRRDPTPPPPAAPSARA